jgi:hypothetical protein
MADDSELHEYEVEIGGILHTVMLTDSDADRVGAKQRTAPANKAVDTGSVRTRASRADGTAGYGN